MGESFAQWLLKEQKCELQYEILVACIARNSTKIRLVASSAQGAGEMTTKIVKSPP